MADVRDEFREVFRERGAGQYEVDEETGCWVCTGSINSRTGCPMFKSRLAYQLAYEELVGPIPDERPNLDHLCGNPRCINPEHLDPVTKGENRARGSEPHFDLRGDPRTSPVRQSKRFTLAERRARVGVLHDQGLTVRQIAEQLGMAPTTVHNDMRHVREKRGESAEPQSSDGLPAIVHTKYGGDVGKALDALVHAQSEIGRLANELGDLRREKADADAALETAARAILDLETRLAEFGGSSASSTKE